MFATFIFLSAISVSAPSSFVQEPPAYDPIGDYQEQCVARLEASVDCAFLRGLVKQEVLDALETIEFSGDQRGVEEALAALDLDEEPEIQIAAGRVLGHFPKTAGIRDRLPRLLLSPYPAVQQVVAQVLARNDDARVAALGQQWINNHGDRSRWAPFEVSPVAAQPARMGVADYPGWVRFPPAESPASAAWLTADAPQKAIDFFSRKSGKRALNADGWAARQEAAMEKQQQDVASFMDRPELQEIQKLAEQYASNPDPALLARIEELQKQLETLSQGMQEGIEDPVTQAAFLGDPAAMEGARYLILEERDGKPTQLLMAYPEAAMGKTVIRLLWDGELYGRAWE